MAEFQKIDLLDKWKIDATEFAMSHLDRPVLLEKIGFIYDRLRSNMGPNFFVVHPMIERPLEKVSWILFLLSNKNYRGAMGALLDISEIIDYVKGLGEDIQKEFRDQRRSALGLRSFFAELYIYRFLDRNGIPNKKKIMDRGHPIEGTCMLDGIEFLFECRKLYAPNLREMDIKFRLLRDLGMVPGSLKHGHPMICTVKFNGQLKPLYRNNFADKIRAYFRRFNALESMPDIRYDHADECGVFSARNYSAELLEEIKEKRDYELLFYLEEPVKLEDQDLTIFNGKILTNFNYTRTTLYKRLEKALAEKKQQHEDSAYPNKIIFLDSESMTEFYLGLFADPRSYDLDEVLRVYNNLHMTDIVCIVRRHFYNDNPLVFVDILRPESLSGPADELKRAFSMV